MEMKERIFHASNIGIWISPTATRSDVQSAHNLAIALKKLGKRVHIISRAPSSLSKNTFTVTLAGLASRVAQVDYEKDKEDLKLHFTLQRGDLRPENISLDISPQTDLTIIVGDNTAQYNYQALYTHILELLLNHQEAAFRLLGIVLLKLEQTSIENKEIYKTHFTQEDFETALVSPKLIPTVAEDLRVHFGDQCSYLFFVEKPEGTAQALLWTSQPQLHDHLIGQNPKQLKGNWALWTSQTMPKPPFKQKLFS